MNLLLDAPKESTSDASGASRDIVIDARCLQDSNYARRGIGRHALTLLVNAPRDAGVRLIGLLDPLMPHLIDEAKDIFDIVVPNAYAAQRAIRNEDLNSAGFISLSPMTHDSDFTARLHSNKRIIRMAVVYDFIPRRFPDRYLPTQADRLRYANSLRWLAKCDIFAPISLAAADDLRLELGVQKHAMTVTGCPIAKSFVRKTGRSTGSQRHILIVGGGDPRKNPEVVIRAHARTIALQQGDGIPLVISGTYSPQDAIAFRALSAESGGRPELVETTGHISDNQLWDLYQGALAVVAPSRDEGFSLPVVEAMAAGVLCLASDIPAHRELIQNTTLCFSPDDHSALAAILDRVTSDQAWRADCLAYQEGVWPRFIGDRVAKRFWDMLLKKRGTLYAPAVLRRRRPKVAMLTPLPPDRSGVADYSAASCEELGKLVDLHLFTETQAPTPRRGVASIRPLTALPHLMPEFDRVIGVIGNSHFHLKIFEYIERYGGACIAHDARMLGFYSILLGRERALAAATKELRRPVDEPELNTWLSDEGTLKALFLGDIAAAAAPMIVHSPGTVELCIEKYGVKPAYVPFSIYRPWRSEELSKEARTESRNRMGVSAADVVIASFGFVHPSKLPEECVWALDSLRRWGIPARLHFVGDLLAMPNGGAALLALIEELGLRDHVRTWKGHVSEQDYRDHLVGSNLGVQLRTYDLGGLSGALLDCAAAGLPTVANSALTQSVGVPAAYTKAIRDAISPLLLAEALADLHDQACMADSARNREDARIAYSNERSFRSYAERLCQVLQIDVGPRFNISRS